MNNIVESQIDSALSALIGALVSFVIANLLIVLLVIVVIACLIGLVILNSKRKHSTQVLKRAGQLQQDAASRLSTVLVTDTFKELELGLAQGDTERGLQHMQKAAFALHKQSEQLGVKLKEYRSSYFAPFEALHQAEELELEAEDLHERVERYLNDLSSIEQSVRSTGQHIRQLKERLDSVIAQVEKLGNDRGYSLEAARRQLKQVEAEFEKTDQLAAFDAVQAKSELSRVGRLIDATQTRIQELQKNITIMDQIRSRLQKQEEQLLVQIEQEQLKFAVDGDPVTLIRKTDPIVERLDVALRAGEIVDLRAAASEIELILHKVMELVDLDK